MSNGKGDSPRPLSVDQETFKNNWDRVFGPKKIDDGYGQYVKELHTGMFFEWYPGLSGDWEKDQLRWTLVKLTKEAQQMGLYNAPRKEKGND
jgi:hypothetical protein